MTAFDALARSLTAKAERLAAARAEMRLRTRRGDATRWHRAALLWPLFTQRS